MSEDKREAILARLVEVAKTLTEPDCVFRNQTEIPESKRPAIVILDADETADEAAYGRGRPANAPNVILLQPEIFILLEAAPDKIGTELNGFRNRVLKAVLHDASLLALCKDGDIRYDGFATGLAVGRSMEGEGGIGLTFRYVLRPDKL